MKTIDKICLFFIIAIGLGAFAIGIYESKRTSDEAQKLCYPFRVKHYYVDENTGKTHAVCASLMSDKDELR